VLSSSIGEAAAAPPEGPPDIIAQARVRSLVSMEKDIQEVIHG
jgi:hypothetical protein